MQIRESVPLAPYTTFHIGGVADYFVEVETVDELMLALSHARERSLRVTILGGGSNVLISDEGTRGLVIRICIPGITSEELTGGRVHVRVGAGVLWDAFVAHTIDAELWGCENLSAIPGTVGATPVQNVGAYGVEIKDVVESVEVCDIRDGQLRTFSNSECAFGYRSSVLKTEEGKHFVVTHVTYVLSKTPSPKLEYVDLAHIFGERTKTPTLLEIRNALILIRSRKFPDIAMVGTAGSFFKNPRVSKEQFALLKERYPLMPGYVESDTRVKIPLGWILDRVLHVRGACTGAVCTYRAQALVIVNNGGATAREVRTFAEKISNAVKKMCDIDIEWEVTELK